MHYGHLFWGPTCSSTDTMSQFISDQRCRLVYFHCFPCEDSSVWVIVWAIKSRHWTCLHPCLLIVWRLCSDCNCRKRQRADIQSLTRSHNCFISATEIQTDKHTPVAAASISNLSASISATFSFIKRRLLGSVAPPLDVFLRLPFKACKMVFGFYLFIYLFLAGDSLRALPLSLLAGRRGETAAALRHLANRPNPVMDHNSPRRKHTTLRQPAYTHDNTAALAGGRRTQQSLGVSRAGVSKSKHSRESLTPAGEAHWCIGSVRSILVFIIDKKKPSSICEL